jgi:hypothetical protein
LKPLFRLDANLRPSRKTVTLLRAGLFAIPILTAKVLLTQPVRGLLCTYSFGFFGFGFDPPDCAGLFGCFVPSLAAFGPFPQLPGGGFGCPFGHVSGGFPQLLPGPPCG